MRAGGFVDDRRSNVCAGKVWSLREDAEGRSGSARTAPDCSCSDGALTRFTTKDGLPSNKIHFIVEDAQGNLWMSGPSGVVAVSRREIESLSRLGAASWRCAFSTAEGLSTNQMNGGVQPAGALLASGEMWFPSAKGAVHIGQNGPDHRSRRR